MEARALEHECEVFTRHLVGMAPNAHVLRSYDAAHAARPEAFGRYTRALGAYQRELLESPPSRHNKRM